MNLLRTFFILRTCVARAAHRRGFGIQSPWAYELVRDVLFEQLHYYAYADLGLRTPWERQLWRIRNHFRDAVEIVERGREAERVYEQAVAGGRQVIVVEHIDGCNAGVWQRAVQDSRATVTFDMRRRGLIVIDPKRIKQNYLL